MQFLRININAGQTHMHLLRRPMLAAERILVTCSKINSSFQQLRSHGIQ